MEMKYNGLLLTESLIQVLDVRKYTIDKNILTTEIPYKHGAWYQGFTYNPKVIEVDFFIQGDYLPDEITRYNSEFMNKVRSLNFLLNKNESPCSLIFSDEPSLEYFAIVQNFDLERTLQYGQGTIQFYCPIPFAYSIVEKTFKSDEDGNLILDNWGTAPTHPKFKLNFYNPSNFVSILAPKGIIMLGNPAKQSKEAGSVNGRIFYDECLDSSGFYAGSQALLPYYLVSDSSIGLYHYGNNLRPQTFPEGEADTGKYYGSFFLHDVPKHPELFKAYARVDFQSSHIAQKGMLMVLGYDEQNQILFKLELFDKYDNTEFNFARGHIGSAFYALDSDEKPSVGTSQVYTKQIQNNDELPKGATIISEVEKTTYWAKVVPTGSRLFVSPNTNSKVVKTVVGGTKLKLKSESTNFAIVYYNETQTAYIPITNYQKEEGETIRTVTYRATIPPTNSGRWNNFYGFWEVKRERYDKEGYKWTISLNRLSSPTTITDSWSKVYYDKTGTTYGTPKGTKLAKIGIFFGKYENAPAVNYQSVAVLYVDGYDNVGGTSDNVTNVVEHGDVIEIDCENSVVTKNGEIYMTELDIGSDFFEIDSFSETPIVIQSQDPIMECEATFKERWL